MMTLQPDKSQFHQTGQSLIEVIIGATIAGIFILGASNLLSISNIGSYRNKEQQTATFLAQELVENVSAYADAKWYCVSVGSCAATKGIYNLNKGSTNKYFLANMPFEWMSGEETVAVSNINYIRHFFVENICRNPDGSIAGVQSGTCGGVTVEDPSTQKITVVIKWTTGGQNFNLKLEKYIARIRNAAIVQTDWSGGSGQSGLYSDVTKYDIATGAADGGATGLKGTIKINGY